MFCPSCKDEFRPGFTHCGRCDVDLVEDLSQVAEPSEKRPELPPKMPVRMVDYCGFFSLQDARHAREQLRNKRIRSEIVIREPLDVNWDEPAKDEYWIRIDAVRAREAQALMDALEGADAPSEELFACENCGADVAEEEAFCPKCGARFDG